MSDDVKQATAATFAAAAEHFCAVVEGELPDDRLVFVAGARHPLSKLYVTALELPSTQSDLELMPRRSHDEWRALFDRLTSYLGDLDRYWEVYDPYTLADPVGGSLADDLADVAVDIQGGLKAYRAGHIDAALWEWRNPFWFHWGHHAADALRALTRIPPEEEDLLTRGSGVLGSPP